LVPLSFSATVPEQFVVRIAMSTTKEQLQVAFVGKSLDEVPVPSVVLDLAKLRANCQRMLDAVAALGLGWRAHIKTHKVCSRPVSFRELLPVTEC
jgi:hypothetical protein